MQLNLLRPPTRSSGIINNKICKKKTKNYPSRCFYINHELQKRKRRKCSLAYFIEKHPRDWFTSVEWFCSKYRPLLALRFLSRLCQVMSCAFLAVLIEHFRATLESFGVTVIVWKGGWQVCAVISQFMPLVVGDTPIEKKKEKTKETTGNLCLFARLLVFSNIFKNTLIEHPQSLLNKLSVSEYISLRGCDYLSKRY